MNSGRALVNGLLGCIDFDIVGTMLMYELNLASGKSEWPVGSRFFAGLKPID